MSSLGDLVTTRLPINQLCFCDKLQLCNNTLSTKLQRDVILLLYKECSFNFFNN